MSVSSSVPEVLAALRLIHDAGWDGAADLVRLAPGTVPGVDIAPFDLHAVRETALGAYLDLRDGNVDRAAAGLRRVLEQQYDAPGRPWDGTFRVTAEQADPPGEEAVEWLHYDPNWRQFLGVILALTVEDFGASLPADLVASIEQAIGRAVDGEPVDRIPVWYTNPNLMHAWLQAWAGNRLGRGELVAAGGERAAMVLARLDASGDVDEYNSPTYDGIDLLAASLWCSLPPTPAFADGGQHIIQVIGGRLSRLYHPGLHAVVGPHIRAYGLDLSRYVSLVGLWLLLAGEPANRVLPPTLDRHTVHVHDLAFLPLCERLAGAVLPSLVVSGEFPREHQQTFGPVIASSRLTDRAALGAERGRVAQFARDQYVPLTVHVDDGAGSVAWIGVKLADGAAQIDGAIVGGGVQGTVHDLHGAPIVLTLVSSAALHPTEPDGGFRLGPIRVTFEPGPVTCTGRETPAGFATDLRFPVGDVAIAIDGGPAARSRATDQGSSGG